MGLLSWDLNIWSIFDISWKELSSYKPVDASDCVCMWHILSFKPENHYCLQQSYLKAYQWGIWTYIKLYVTKYLEWSYETLILYVQKKIISFF